MTLACIVLAAGGSSRLGRAKQLLPFRGRTLLDAVLDTARACGFDQRVIALGGASRDVRSGVDLTGWEVVENPSYGTGCSSSIAAAVRVLAPTTEVAVLLLGDQPGVSSEAVRRLLNGRGEAPIAVCRYQDGIGHPFAFAKSVFPMLGALHGDKAVWKLVEQRAAQVTEVVVTGTIPADVDTQQDYERLISSTGSAPQGDVDGGDGSGSTG